MWASFAALTGGAAAGLTGLTFIVVSFRFDTLAVSDEYRNRAAQTLLLFLTITVLAVLITVPQPLQVLGAEMLATAVASGLLLSSLDSAARRQQKTRPSMSLRVGLILFVTFVAATGVTLVLGIEWGLYFYVVSALIALVWGVNGAWTFLTRAGVHPTTPVDD